MFANGQQYTRVEAKDMHEEWGKPNSSLDHEVTEAYHAGKLCLYTNKQGKQFILLDGGKK